MTKQLLLSFMLGLSVMAFIAPSLVHAAPFIQCGNQDGGQYDEATKKLPGCTVEDIFYTAARIINYLFTGAAIIAVGGIVYGGFLMITSLGNESKRTTGKQAIFNSAIGLAIVLLAILIVQTTLTAFRFKGDPRSIITNPIEYFKGGQ